MNDPETVTYTCSVCGAKEEMDPAPFTPSSMREKLASGACIWTCQACWDSKHPPTKVRPATSGYINDQGVQDHRPAG
jgi:hypothetical protein